MDLRGHLDLLLLAALQKTGPTHGYAVVEALRERSGGEFDLPEGTVYPALHRLQRSGLLTSTWGETGGRRRRVYSLTSDGRKALVAKRREWNMFAGAVQRVVKGTPWPKPTTA